MKRLRRLAAFPALALLAAPTLPCSAFLVCGEGRVLLGNNEDYWDPNTRLWFVPAKEGRHGVAYLGYANLYPQGGLNDAGLAFDGFATGEVPLTEQEGKPNFEGNLIAEVMETCATVEEAVAFLEAHDLSMLSRAMLFFADATGDAVIVEGDAFVRKEGAFQVVTNFYQSRQEDDRAQCTRFASAVSMLEARGETSVALCRGVLATTAQEAGAPTQYSNVFDLKERRIHLYHFHNFEQALVLDLDVELAKGERTLVIPDLFPETFAYRTFVRKQEQDIARKIAARRGPPVAGEVLDELAGRYQLDVPSGPVVVAFRRDGERLLCSSDALERSAGESELEVFPQSEDQFFLIASQGTYLFRFTRDDDGGVAGLVVESQGEVLRGVRMAE